MEVNLINVTPRNLYPNDYNPNHLGTSKFKMMKNALADNGINETPIVIRPKDDETYEIVDGEHTWRAAIELNLDTVLCELRNYDDFEARVQTMVRNVHGTADIVREGRLLLEMQEDMGGAPTRDLSQLVGMSRPTLQRRLVYGRLSKLREQHIAENTESYIPNDADLGKLKFEDAKELLENGVIPEPDMLLPPAAKKFMKNFARYPDDTQQEVLKLLKKQVTK